ncbi:MAG TPA: carboxypeptidase regulatory-like domain-containing protein [Caulobacteraceae bacterium]|jgi:hypothetical protein
MITMKKLAGGVALSALMLASATAVYAQETTGAIRGQVTNEAGAAVPNASVVITHVPTGTRNTTVTGPDGFYTARGLRVGGPYTVTVTGPDADPETSTVEAIGLGDPAEVDITLFAAANVEGVVVTAQRAAVVTSGPSTRYGEDDIENRPSIGRDLRDTFRSDPFVTIDVAQAGAVTVAGTNFRNNSIVIDGVKQNDDFGLNLNPYPTLRSPINIDAVEAVSVSVAPYGVLNNDFLGAQINVVTKGGSNRFEGSLYGQRTDDSLIGDSIRGQPFDVTFQEETWGATFGGPIWRDRAFFFASYEDFEAIRPLSIGPAGSGRSIAPAGITTADVTNVQTGLAGTYNFAYDQNNSLLGAAPSLPELDVKEQARIDINVTDNHRVRLTYQNTESNRFFEGETSNSTRLSLLSSQYSSVQNLKTMTAQLNSDWTDRIRTEVFYNTKEVESPVTPVAGCAEGPTGTGDEVCEFANFNIALGNGSRIIAGPDISRQANILGNETATFGARGYFTFGAHELLVGAEREEVDIFNLFAQRTEGEYDFDNIANFQARTARRLQYQNAVIDVNGDGFRNELDLAAAFTIGNTALYIEDNWRISDTLSITPGIRYERIENEERPALNQFFATRYGFGNDATLEGKEVFLPRLAFDWDAPYDVRVQGGIGLFSGGTPNVYISNSYSNTGVAGVQVSCERNAAGVIQTTSTCPAAVAAVALNNVNGFDIPAQVEALLNPALGGVANLQRAAAVNALDPDFELPQSWKMSLTLQRDFDIGGFLGNDWRFTADLLHSRVRYTPFLVDIRSGMTPRGTAPDGRPIYNNAAQRGTLIGATGPDTGRDILLTNADMGHSTTVAFALEKSWDWGLDLTLSQTFNRAEDVQAFTSSTAGSNLTLTATSDPQRPQLATSNYEIPYSTKLSASWARKFFGDNETRVTLFSEWRAGRPYSMTFNPIILTTTGGVVTGRTSTGATVATFGTTGNNQLLYVPRNADASDPIIRYENTIVGGAVVQTAEQTQGLLAQLYNSAGLSEYAGGVAPRNAFRSNDVTRIDMRVQQELPAFFPGGAKIQAFVDFQNIGNMLNDEWGVLEEVDFPYLPGVVDVRIDAATNQYVYSNFRPVGTVTSSSFSPTRSVWQIAFGLKYEF